MCILTCTFLHYCERAYNAAARKGANMLANFLESLHVMGLGMLGIFSVAIVLVLIMTLLTKLFPAKEEEDDDKVI